MSVSWKIEAQVLIDAAREPLLQAYREFRQAQIDAVSRCLPLCGLPAAGVADDVDKDLCELRRFLTQVLSPPVSVELAPPTGFEQYKQELRAMIEASVIETNYDLEVEEDFPHRVSIEVGCSPMSLSVTGSSRKAVQRTVRRWLDHNWAVTPDGQ